MKVIFMGKEKEAAVASLFYLFEKGIEVAAIVGPHENEASPSGFKLAEIANSRNMPFCAADEIDAFVAENEKKLKKKLDYVMSFLFWERIREPLLELPRHGCINFHPAPLPEFRGVGGYNVAILDAIPYWGVAAHFVDEGIDTGDVIAQKRFPIDPDKETAFSLEKKSMKALYELFVEVIDAIKESGKPKGKPQGEGRYISMREMEQMKKIERGETPEQIDRKIRAYWFPPHRGAYLEMKGHKYTVVSDEILRETAQALQEWSRSKDEFNLEKYRGSCF